MKTYNVRVMPSAEADIDDLADFLFETISKEGAYRYLDFMRQEILSMSIYADCFAETHSNRLRAIHPKAKKWFRTTTNGRMSSISKSTPCSLTE
jgi:plasmid stabilization system protein ParE